MAVANQAQVDGLFNVGGSRLKANEYIVDVEKMLATNVKQAMEKLGATIVRNISINAPASSGALQNRKNFTIEQIKDTSTGYRLEIKIGVDYADYVDKGVKGIKNRRKTYPNAEGKYYQFKNYYMPPEALKNLEGWANRKNIELEATSLIKGRKGIDKITSPASKLAYFIKKYGIEGRNYQKKSIDEARLQFDIDVKTIGTDTLILRISK